MDLLLVFMLPLGALGVICWFAFGLDFSTKNSAVSVGAWLAITMLVFGALWGFYILPQEMRVANLEKVEEDLWKSLDSILIPYESME